MFIVMVLLIFVNACSLSDESSAPESPQALGYHFTGNTAVDNSIPYMSPEELSLFGILDTAPVVEADAAEQGNIGPVNGLLDVHIYGPLHDQRLVKGKKLAISLYKGNGGLTGTWTVHYGYAEQGLNYTAPLSQSTYGNYVTFIQLDHATIFYFKIVSADGTVVDDRGKPFAARIFDSILSYTLKDGKLTISYSGPSSGSDTYFHLGWNNWANTADYGSSYDNWPIHKYAQPADYNYATVDVPWWANYVDVAVHGNGRWDNNMGQDYHSSIRPLVNAQVSSHWNGRKQISIYYAGGSLNPVKAHYGIDGWQEVNTTDMTYNYAGQWNAIVNVNEDSDILNAVFTDGNGKWDNNFGKNWNLDINPHE